MATDGAGPSLHAFKVRASSVGVLHTPTQFYERILAGIRGAEKRVVLCSLYLGTGELERKVVEELHQRHSAVDALRSTVLLDASRGTRESRDGTSSATMLAPVAGAFPSAADVRLFHTPLLRGMLKRLLPPRANEVVGVQHMKFFIFDDDVLCSGANMSTDYFTNRQDRYVTVEGEASFADYCADLVNCVGSFSYRLLAPCEGSQHGSKGIEGGYSLALPEGCPSPSAEHGKFAEFAKGKLAALKASMGERQSTEAVDVAGIVEKANGGNREDVAWITPSLEMQMFGLDEDKEMLLQLLKRLNTGHWFLATAYFNVSETVTKAIARSAAAWSVLTASPKANGFFGAKGLAGYIPDMYRSNEVEFLRLVDYEQEEEDGRTTLHEYEREGWTFHGKGLWWYPMTASAYRPVLTVFGSSNFGKRSYARDIEAQLTLVTANQSLQQRLHDECKRLFKGTAEVGLPDLSKGDNAPSLTGRVLGRFMKSFL